MRSLDPAPGTPYPGLLRATPFDPMRPLVALVAGLFAFLLVSLVGQALLAAAWLVRGRPGTWEGFARAGLAFHNPEGMLAAHVALALLVPAVLGILFLAGRLAPRWAHSVQPGFRWRYFALVLALALVVLIAAVAAQGRFELGAATPQPGFWAFFVVIALTSPLQAAGEEYLFRGLLLQALGAWVRSPWFAIVASALVFALFHGVQSAPLFVDRFAFGVLAGVLVWRTGGLEAGIAIHAVNNVLAFTTAGLFGTIAAARQVRDISWAAAVGDVSTFAIVAALAWWCGRRLRLATTTPGAPELPPDADMR